MQYLPHNDASNKTHEQFYIHCQSNASKKNSWTILYPLSSDASNLLVCSSDHTMCIITDLDGSTHEQINVKTKLINDPFRIFYFMILLSVNHRIYSSMNNRGFVFDCLR